MTHMPRDMVANAVRRLANLFPGYFEGQKHNHYADFGWPESLPFPLLYDMFCRNALARAAVKKTVRKVWETHPTLREAEEGAAETPIERDIRQRFVDLRLWQQLAEAHRRSLVGSYGGAILRVADSRPFREPVDGVPGGLAGLVEIIPAWEGQLKVAEWDTREESETYGYPLMFQFNEAEVGTNRHAKVRSFDVHPDRVLVWSDDGTVHGRPFLEPGYNDLLTIEKIVGAGGEGFWKNAKQAPVLQVNPEANLDQMAQAMGVPRADLIDAMNDQVDDWQKGFDKLLMLQSIEAKTLGITLPSPEHFYAVALQNFAASIEMPTKILVGMQTGERASEEDAAEWARTSMARRSDSVVPNIMGLVNRLAAFGILPERDWWLDWEDLTEADMGEKIARADKMADVNAKMAAGGELVFLPEEIRAAVGLEPLAADAGFAEPFGEPEDEQEQDT